MAPTWMTAVKPMRPSLGLSSLSRPMTCSAISRWPVLEIGRNSVTPSTTPRTTACAMFKKLRRSRSDAGELEGLDGGAQGLLALLDVTGERREGQRRDASGREHLHLLSDLLLGAEQRRLLDELV